MNIRSHAKLPLAGLLAFSLLAASVTGRAVPAAEMVFSDGVRVSFSEFGTMIMALVSGGAPAKAALTGTLDVDGKKSNVSQAWGTIEGNKAGVAVTENEVQVSGVLVTSKDDPLPGTKIAEFHIAYNKVSPTELSVNVELTYCGEAQWKYPFNFRISFPISELHGGSCELETGSGNPEKFEIDATDNDFPQPPHKAVTISQGKQSVTIRPSGSKSGLVFQDTRSYKGDQLAVLVYPPRGSFTNPLFSTFDGQKEAFGVTIIFDSAK